MKMEIFNPNLFSILAIDDSTVNLKLVQKVVEKGGYKCLLCSDSEEAFYFLENHNIDLILMDLMMPTIDGLQLCSKIKSDPKFQEIPIIFITANYEKENLIQAFDLGAVDYINKPFYPKELLARIKTHLELKYTRDQLQKTLTEVEKLATTDYLTGIPNRRHFYTLAEREFRIASRRQHSFSLLVIDLDKFKTINDNYGHPVGDEAIKLSAQEIINSLRQEDLCSRWGGEEFVVLLSDTNMDEAKIVAERIRNKISQLKLEVNDKNLTITVSIGLTIYHPNDSSLDAVFQRADQALLQAKNNGRNRVICY
jgi:diguanylate cyclase (GGDEF)-like protein